MTLEDFDRLVEYMADAMMSTNILWGVVPDREYVKQRASFHWLNGDLYFVRDKGNNYRAFGVAREIECPMKCPLSYEDPFKIVRTGIYFLDCLYSEGKEWTTKLLRHFKTIRPDSDIGYYWRNGKIRPWTAKLNRRMTYNG